MKFIPHDYQSYCTEYIKTHPVAALFLDNVVDFLTTVNRLNSVFKSQIRQSVSLDTLPPCDPCRINKIHFMKVVAPPTDSISLRHPYRHQIQNHPHLYKLVFP